MTTELFAITGHPLSLASPILSVVGIVYPDARVTSKAGYAFAVTSESGSVDHDALRRLMEVLDDEFPR